MECKLIPIKSDDITQGNSYSKIEKNICKQSKVSSEEL